MVAEEGGHTPRSEEFLELFFHVKPQASSHPLVRIGENRDGSYLIPDDLAGIEACFSPGVNNFKTFEDFLVDAHGIKCHMCDFTSDEHRLKTPLKPGMQTFQKKWLDTNDGGDNITLDNWVEEYAPSGDLLLQMDIEGAEYRNLLNVGEQTLSRFRIIILEVHGLSKILDPGILRSVLLPFFRKLGRSFACVHAHPNNCCGEFSLPGLDIRMPNVLELTYYRTDNNRDATHPAVIPNPLDVSRNVRSKPPLFLNEAWLSGPRPLEARVKMLEDQMEWTSAGEPSSPSGVLDLVLGSLDTLRTAVAEDVRQTPDRNGDAFTELAKGASFALSSTYRAGTKTGSVGPNGSYFFHTAIGSGEYIQIDLGGVFDIGKLSVFNRVDRANDRADRLFCVLSEGRDIKGGKVFFMSPSAEFLSGSNLECSITIPITLAHFVTFTSPRRTALHSFDVKVFGFRRNAS